MSFKSFKSQSKINKTPSIISGNTTSLSSNTTCSNLDQKIITEDSNNNNESKQKSAQIEHLEQVKVNKSSAIIMNASQLNASIPTSTNSKEIDQLKDLSGSSSTSFENYSNESPNSQTLAQSGQNQNQQINSISSSVKSSQIAEAISTATNATSEALSNLISSTESSKHLYALSPNSSLIGDDKLKQKQLQKEKDQASNQHLDQIESESKLGDLLTNENNKHVRKISKEKSKKPWYSVSSFLFLIIFSFDQIDREL